MSSQSLLPPARHWVQHGAARMQNWPDCLPPRTLAVFLNFSGEADLQWRNGDRMLLRPGDMLWLRAPHEGLNARRLPGRDSHDCLTLHFPDSWITSTLRAETHADIPAHLRPLLIAPFAPNAAVTQPLTP